MNLKRHHVLYGLLAVSLIVALIVFLMPAAPSVSYTAPQAKNEANAASSTAPAIRFEVVTTLAAQEQGLGGRTDIPENYGMLFVFPNDARRGFWMKDMLAPIDMIWLSDTGTIVGVESSVSPDTYPKVFFPPSPVRFVLETRAGEAQRKGWSAGSKVPLPLPYGK